MTDKEKINSWRLVECNPQYEINTNGEVRHLKRQKLLKHKMSSDGYHRVCLSAPGLKNGKYWSVARLVAQAFIPNPNNLPQVNHIDGDKNNNNVNNLEWVSAKDNIHHSIRTGLRKQGDEYISTVIHKEYLPAIHGLRELGLTYRQIGEMFNVCSSAISITIYSKRYLKYYDEAQFRKMVSDYIIENQLNYNKRILYKGMHTRAIIQTDKNGNFMRKFPSISEAAKANNVLHTSISNNLKGRSKLCGGYKYEYER